MIERIARRHGGKTADLMRSSTRPQWTIARREVMRELTAMGLSIAEIARITRRSKTQINFLRRPARPEVQWPRM